MKKFQRKIEDFSCENCGRKIKGNGYTNHCPYCLWSKHVDVNPGDRASSCQGKMQPVRLEIKKGNCHITHKCLHCGYEKRNKAQKEDDPAALIKLAGKH